MSSRELDALKRFNVWPIFGRVTSFQGKPVGGVKVRLDVGIKQIPAQSVETNLRGEFSAEFRLAEEVKKITVEAAASKEGYLEARESIEFEADRGVTSFDVVVREAIALPDLLSTSQLIEAVRPRLRASPAGPFTEAATADYRRGLDLTGESGHAGEAVRLLARVVEAEPDCVDCRTALGLAHLFAGSNASARRTLEEAARRADSSAGPGRTSEPYVVLGVVEAWRGDTKQALGYFLKALVSKPDDPLALREAGRTLFLGQEWEAADRYLEKALSVNASPDARLLRIRVLLELDDPAEAAAEMEAYLAGRSPKEIAPPARLLYARLQERLELQAYGAVKSLADQPLSDLLRLMPELANLEPAVAQDELPVILERIGQNVEGFFRHLPNISSREEIREEILHKDGKTLNTFEEQFQYLLVLRPEDQPSELREYRTRGGEGGVKSDALVKGFMRTSGFAVTSLHFHPLYQPSVQFRFLGRQALDGRPTAVIAFAQRPESAKITGRFNVDGKSVPVLIQGIAWADANTYQIVRMRTDLLKPPPQSRLQRETTEIQYGEVRFRDRDTAMWLPREVTVTVEWKRKVFRNWHRYSDFKVFRVDAKEKRKEAARLSADPSGSE
jgi:tetratricopeptide (TPR) repeat protein